MDEWNNCPFFIYKIFLNLEKCICKLTCESIKKPGSFSTGSGFICKLSDDSKRYLATAYHVLDPDGDNNYSNMMEAVSKSEIQFNNGICPHSYIGRDNILSNKIKLSEFIDFNDEEIEKRIHPIEDYVILPIKDEKVTSDGFDFANCYLKLESDVKDIHKKDIIIIQFPNAGQYNKLGFDTGSIWHTNRTNNNLIKVIEHNASTIGGSSGSPIISLTPPHIVVGIHIEGFDLFSQEKRIKNLGASVRREAWENNGENIAITNVGVQLSVKAIEYKTPTSFEDLSFLFDHKMSLVNESLISFGQTECPIFSNELLAKAMKSVCLIQSKSTIGFGFITNLDNCFWIVTLNSVFDNINVENDTVWKVENENARIVFYGGEINEVLLKNIMTSKPNTYSVGPIRLIPIDKNFGKSRGYMEIAPHHPFPTSSLVIGINSNQDFGFYKVHVKSVDTLLNQGSNFDDKFHDGRIILSEQISWNEYAKGSCIVQVHEMKDIEVVGLVTEVSGININLHGMLHRNVNSNIHFELEGLKRRILKSICKIKLVDLSGNRNPGEYGFGIVCKIQNTNSTKQVVGIFSPFREHLIPNYSALHPKKQNEGLISAPVVCAEFLNDNYNNEEIVINGQNKPHQKLAYKKLDNILFFKLDKNDIKEDIIENAFIIRQNNESLSETFYYINQSTSGFEVQTMQVTKKRDKQSGATKYLVGDHLPDLKVAPFVFDCHGNLVDIIIAMSEKGKIINGIQVPNDRIFLGATVSRTIIQDVFNLLSLEEIKAQ